jgi:hypothetical protein
MDYAGLVQYFNIGSPGKRLQNRSPRFHRMRIGQFGIGKFSSLMIARRFEVLTRRGKFAARVVFDREVLQHIHTALARNPGFSPFGPIPYGEKHPGAGGAAALSGKGTGEGAGGL